MTATKILKYVLFFLVFALVAELACPPFFGRVEAQRKPLKLYNALGSSYATQLDGATQYWSNTTPVNMDLNGTELLSTPTVDAGITGWSTASAHGTITAETGIKRTGAGSLKYTSTNRLIQSIDYL
jgi:hypothetical protein